MERIVERETAQRALMKPDDLYKLIYQAALGGAHMGVDSAMALTWLQREVSTLDAGGPESLVDTIAPGGAVVRINLRPYVAAGYPLPALASAFAVSAQDYRSSRALLTYYWLEMERLAAHHRIPFSADSLRAVWEREQSRGFPAPEHSGAYIAAYHPAYRVITGAECARRGWCP